MCGVFEGGFARFRCEGCAREYLVPFSCKGRGFCPSCGGRRMTERAAHLVDGVLPRVPVRQWVLTVPYRLRYRMAFDHGLSRAVLGVYARVLLDAYARGARQRGIHDGRTGMVTVIQRSASGLNVNPHFHTLALDGVFSHAGSSALEFHPAPAPSDDDVAEVLATVRHRVQRLLVGLGLEPGDDATGPADRLAADSPLLAGIVSASVQGRVALGSRAGARARRVGQEPDVEAMTSRGPRQAHLEGFDLHANVWVSANDRAGLVLAPRARCRRRVVAYGRVAPDPTSVSALAQAPDGAGEQSKPRSWSWAALMRRAFAIDVLACPNCGGRMRLIATIHDPAVIREILAHLGLSQSGKSPGPAPPEPIAAAP